MKDSASGSQTLKCSCGFYTTLSSYMLLHLSEGRCVPTDGHCHLVRQRLSELHVRRMGLADTLVKLEEEERSLGGILALAEKPIVRARARRPCCICHKLTNEMFGEVPQCVRHTGGKSVVAAHGKVVEVTDEQKAKLSGLIEDAFYGN